MGDNFFLFLIVLTVFAIFLREDSVLTLVVLPRRRLRVKPLVEPPRLAGRGIQAHAFSTRAFLYEKVPVQLELVNNHWLPVPWLQFTETSAAGIDRAQHVSQRHHHRAVCSPPV